VKFVIEQTFATTLARMEGLLDDPALHERLARDLPGLESIELLERTDSDGKLHRRLRYTPRAADRIPSYGRGVITPEMLIWIEDSTFHRAEHRIDWHTEPNLPPKWRARFDSRGTFQYSETSGGVLRRIEGEVTVRVALFGGLAERFLIGELKRSFTVEAALLKRWLE
jgi:hypothetical protein